jgi:Na+/H+ antiporter
MQAAGLHQIELLILILLVFVVGFGALAKRLRTPYPIVLVIGGLLVSFVPGVPRFSLNPDFVFLLILPPLLFAAAFTTSWRDFRYNLVSITSLAFGLVGFTVFGVAAAAHAFLPGFDWRLGLVLGAVVSTTDAIAATSIARRIGLPRRIIDILEGESLVNDASGLLALEFTVALVVTGQTPTFAEGAARLLYLVIGGSVIGLILARAVHWIEKRIDDAPIEITISIVTPYAAYLAAEGVHSSGVLATVACGLYLGRHSVRYFSSAVRIEAYAVWKTLTFVLNGIVFILIGLQLPYIVAGIRGLGFRQLLVSGILFSLLVILLRLMWVYPGARVSYWIRRRLLGQHESTPPLRALFVIGWTGMRGVVALAAAISLPETLANGQPFPQRNVILFLTFSVILVTLVLQGLTLPFVIRRLKVAGDPLGNCEEQEARRIMISAALDKLNEMRSQDDPEFKPIYDDLVEHYHRRMAAIEGARSDHGHTPEQYRHYRALAHALRNVEGSAVIQLRDQNRINDQVLRTLQRELDLAEARSELSEPDERAG